MTEELLKIAERLDELVADRNARVSVAVETSPDEAFFVATRDGYVRLAARLLRSAIAESDPTLVGSQVRTSWSTHCHGVADSLAQVCVDAECRVETEKDREEIVRYFSQLPLAAR